MTTNQNHSEGHQCEDEALRLRFLQQRVQQLEKDLCNQVMRNSELETLLIQRCQKLDEESFEKEVIELERDQHKQALVEKIKDIQLRDETIEALNSLLALSWMDSEHLVTVQDSSQRLLQLLQSHLGSSYKPTPDTENSKKRRLSP
jgi:MoxR-like ATPase